MTANRYLHRDPRVDFFRGVAFIIILIAHIPANWVGRWIPAKFGFSDATEMFVFMSGFAAGIAFGSTFVRAGFGLGSARIAYRAWQVYVAHVLLFFFILLAMLIANHWFDTRDYVQQLNLTYFLEDTGRALVGIFTLTYVPNFFDILPMYIVILMMIPVFMGLARIHPWLALGASIALYLANLYFRFDIPAEVSPDRNFRPWFFNPFGWQLIFFTGFAFTMGYLKLPPFKWWLALLCMGMIALGVIYDRREIYDSFAWAWEIRDFFWEPPGERLRGGKTNLDIVRYLHFMAIAYLVVWALKGREDWLRMKWAAPISQCGRQSLPVFLFSMFLSRIFGVVLDQTGREDIWVVVFVNGIAVGCLIGIAYLLAWLKSNPWTPRKSAPATGRDGPAMVPQGAAAAPVRAGE